MEGDLDVLLRAPAVLLGLRSKRRLVGGRERRLDEGTGPQPAVQDDVQLGGVDRQPSREVDPGQQPEDNCEVP